MSHVRPLRRSRLVDEPCSWRNCENVADHPEHPLCEAHYRRVGLQFVNENVELIQAIAGTLTVSDLVERLAGFPDDREPRTPPVKESVVYYARIGDVIKIGFTTNLVERLRALRVQPGGLLAVEPGGRDVERSRHLEFADERYGAREDFAMSTRLMAHIEALQPA